MGRRLGLVIGVNTYQDASWQPLQYAETDARALAQWLVNARGGQWNPADVQVVLGREATQELIENLLSQLCLQMAAPDDLILIYFAGHAFVDQASGDGYLAGSNTRPWQVSSGIHLLTLVSQVMVNSPASQIFCILDCFQNGPAWSMRRSSRFDYAPLLGPMLQNGLQQIQGRILYCSCRGNEMAPEMSEKGLGSFMYRLIMGVSGPAFDLASGQVEIQRLHAFLATKLDEQHQPQIFGQESRPLVLVGDMPSFGTGSPYGGGAPDGFPPLDGPLARQPMGMAASALAQLSPSASGLGRDGLSAAEQSRRNQCQQLLQQAQQMVQMQNFQQAYQIVERILQIDAMFVDALLLQGQILGAIGQFQEALNVAQQVVQLDPNNALGWSVAATLLANTNQYPEAMLAVDRSLSIEPGNPETIAIKEMIREKLAESQFDTGKRSRLRSSEGRPRDSWQSFWLGLGVQLGALILGIIGIFLELLRPSLPVIVPFLLASVALALLVVNAWRGAYLYGGKRFLSTLFFSIVAAATLGVFTSGLLSTRLAVKPAYAFIVNHVSGSPAMLTPLVFLILWLIAATALPLLAALAGWVAGVMAKRRG